MFAAILLAFATACSGSNNGKADTEDANTSGEGPFGKYDSPISADAIKYHTEIFEGKEYGHFKERAVQDVGNNLVGGNMGHYKKVTAALDSKDSSGLNAERL